MSWSAPTPPPPNLEMFPFEHGTIEAFVDVSLESPEQQYAYLVAMFEGNDYANPAPNTGTPPAGEPPLDESFITDQAIIEHAYLAPADVDAAARAELLSIVSDAHTNEYGHPTWENDDQYHGLGVPPGPPNTDQPIEFGSTQIAPPHPAAEHGWDAWSGRPALARVARMQNYFSGYNAGTHRRMGEYPVEKLEMPYALLTQQYRDMLLAELKARGVHGAVVADVPSVPFTERVAIIDPYALEQEAAIGREGVLP